MDIKDIPKLSLEILKHNVHNYNGLTDDDKLNYFKNSCNVFDIPNLTDEGNAVKIIQDSITNNKFILVVGDVDADGINAAAICYKVFKDKQANFDVLICKRIDGRGMSPNTVAKIKVIHDTRPINLIITVDFGSSDEDAYKELKDYGVSKILVTDHHQLGDKYPKSADVFINAQQHIDSDPVHLCGTTVIFKILSNMYKNDKDIFNNFYKPCLPHAGIATIGDVMSLDINYNRAIVRGSLQIINSDTGVWKDLIDKLNISTIVSYKDYGYVFCPFINCGNRANNEELYYRILVEEDRDTRLQLIAEGVKINTLRKSIRKNTLSLAMKSIIQPVGSAISLIIDCDMAIGGIIAGNVGDKFKRPVTCFQMVPNTNILTGSSRAILDYIDLPSIYKAIDVIEPGTIIKAGGHAMAAGVSIPFDKFDRFKYLFDKVVSEIPKPSKKEPTEYIIDFNTKYLEYGVVEKIDYAGPYGKNWPMPLLRGNFKVISVFAYSSIAIITLRALNGEFFKCTYFYKDGDSELSIDKGDVIIVTFEPQYYKRGNKTNFTLLINTIEEML